MPGSSLIDRSKLEAAWIGFSTIFNMAIEKFNPAFNKIATVVPSSSYQEQYKWLGDLPTMKKWVGDRALRKLRGETHTIDNDDWANGLEVDRNDLRDDKLGLIAPLIAGLAQQAMARMDARVIDFYVNGFDATEGTCYDGQFLWDDDHTAAGNGVGTSQDNHTDAALSEGEFDIGWRTMMEYVDSEGEPIINEPTILLVGPALRATARDIVQQRIQASGEENMNFGSVELIVHPRITGSEWFLINGNAPVKPVILQIHTPPQFVALDSMADLHAFMRKTFLYGADATFGVGYGLWQMGYGSDASA